MVRTLSLASFFFHRRMNASQLRSWRLTSSRLPASTSRTSGAIFTEEDAAKALATIVAEESERRARRDQKGNAHVFLDVSVNDGGGSRAHGILHMFRALVHFYALTQTFVHV